MHSRSFIWGLAVGVAGTLAGVMALGWWALTRGFPG